MPFININTNVSVSKAQETAVKTRLGKAIEQTTFRQPICPIYQDWTDDFYPTEWDRIDVEEEKR